MTRRRILAAVSAAVLAGVGILAATGVIGPQSIDTCVSNWEDAGASGDTMTVCNVTPANLKVPNLETHTEGLHGGCNRGINQSSSWSDCISSAKVAHLTANNKVVWYGNTNYGNQVACWDTDGNSPTITFTGNANDVISSFRILGGNC